MYSPVKGARVSSRYLGGFRSTGGHSGIDFAAPAGSKIYAAVGGRVISVGWGGAYGNLTKVQHDDGTVGYYAHQSRFAVKAGQRISAGSLLGFVGNTGNSTGSHLHFEVRRNGKPTDPIPFLNFDGKRTGSLSKEPAKQGGSFATPQGGMLPDIIQMTDPNDTLAMLEAQGMGASPGGKAAGGFSTPALDAAAGRPSEQTDLEQSLGREAGLIQQSQMMKAMQAQQAAYQTSMMQATAQQAPAAISQGSHSSGGGASGDLGKLINAIRAKESGGSYSARNRHSGALGAYQIMPGNIASWSKAALGYSVSQSQFLANPKLQDAIAQHRLGQYFRKYGASGAALAWYAGEGALKYSEGARNRKQGSYPSMNSYVQDILRRAGL
ncbi:peptidoglycan DD-metalloendopeptidase family protein [Jiangella anatolica]|uniref:M23ase beta-sheet core domain-containing protein n=1 Tax=Jiangella anatolica TaxID=2670374 RepID=A0A2W2BUV0_9ACTN|nr:M23 family metallopeptidase [Jiangella anatolica]PZF84164.1 hypothetical protein C1I92_09955 [Jiangella anatolica]